MRSGAAVLAAAALVACTDAALLKIVEQNEPVYDNKMRLSGRVCTSDPADLLFPLKVLFIIDTSQSMNFNDPMSPTEVDPLLQTGRSKALHDVISKYIDLGATFPPTFCNTGITGCDKGNTNCAACGIGTGMCIGPDCCKGTPCKGVPSCPVATGTNGTCTPLCDVKKLGCGVGEKGCSDCPTKNDQCMGGVCGKHLDPGVEFAIMRFGSAKQVLTKNRDGVEGFTNDVKELLTAIPQVSNGGSVTDYEGALSMAFTTLSRDMLDMKKRNASAVARSKYVVIFLSDGQPDPKINDESDWDNIPKDLQSDLLGAGQDPSVVTEYNVDARILRRAKEIMGLRAIYRVGDIKIHTAYLAGDTPSWMQDSATFLLKQIALVGKGTFRNFQNGEAINFLKHVDFSSLRRVFRVKNFIVSNANARPVAGGLVVDSDGDGLDDALEHEAGTNPASTDTDGDGFSDTVEHFFRASGWDALNPADADCNLKANDLNGDGISDDTDGDGLADCEERFLGTSKDLYDSDGDGIPDGIEVRFGTNPIAVDTEDDLDFDGMPNGDEIRLHTDPRSDDAAHRSRSSYRYIMRQVGTGVENVGRRCLQNADCPSGKDCRESYCRCLGTDSCSSQAACKADFDCTVEGEGCTANKCVGKWTCQPALPTLKDPSQQCGAQKNISCYEYEVENIALVTPLPPPGGGEEGWNRIDLIFGEVPFDNPGDFGNFSVACVRARYLAQTGAKLPATGRLVVPEVAWFDPRATTKTYTATSTDSGGGKKAACGTVGAGLVYCNAGDSCASAKAHSCRLVNCVCPDGNLGACPL